MPMYVNLMQFPQSHAGWPTPAGGHLRKFAFGTFSRLSDHSFQTSSWILQKLKSRRYSLEFSISVTGLKLFKYF